MAPHCLGKLGDAGPRGTDNRLFVEAVLWIVRTGMQYAMADATIVKVHRHGQGAGLKARP